MPWSTANSNSQFYVVSPIAPVAEAHSQFYGNGLCCSVTASCASGATCCQIASGLWKQRWRMQQWRMRATAFGGGVEVVEVGCGGGGGGAEEDGGGRWWQLISIFYQLHQYPVCLYLLNSIFVINLIMTDMVLKYYQLTIN